MKTQTNMNEKRNLERFDLNVPAQISTDESNHEHGYIELTTSNISAGGAFFETGDPLSQGVRVNITLSLPFESLKGLGVKAKNANICTTGTVLRVNGSGMAISFDKSFSITPC
jgi:hypothetical protein